MTERVFTLLAALALCTCTNDFPSEILPGESASCEDLRECLPGLSCCANRWIPGGTFDRGYDASNEAEQDMLGMVTGWQHAGAAPATVSEFRMDVFEVTIGRFRHFMDAYDGPPAPESGAHPRISGSGWQATWDALMPANRAELEARLESCETGVLAGRDELPIRCIDWYVAFAFCAWDGGRLPTEAEWNFVAAGGDQQRAFPWSDPPSDTAHSTEHFVSREIDDPQNVGSRSALDGGRFGIHDLSGNAREWVLDTAFRDYIVPCVDCADLTPSEARMRRGGDFGANAIRGRTAYRGEEDAVTVANYMGIRCVR